MSMQYVRDTYGVPAKRGRLVEIFYRYSRSRTYSRAEWRLWCRGRITSATNVLYVSGGGPYHPTYGVVYLADDGETVLLDTRSQTEGAQ